jgi:hypothetical protein
VENGQIAGRWNVSDLLHSLQAFSVLGTPLCNVPGSPYQTLAKPLICQYADIMTDPLSDQMGKTCDALSLGFGFTAEPALMGDVVTLPVLPSPCGDATPDYCTQ